MQTAARRHAAVAFTCLYGQRTILVAAPAQVSSWHFRDIARSRMDFRFLWKRTSFRGPELTDTVEKGFWGRSLSNIDSRSNATAQSRFKNPFVRIRLFQILIPQLHFGDFFNS